jgi:hypothetical protein
MRHEHCNLRLVVADRTGDLDCGEHQAARRMQNDIQWHIGVRHVNGAENLFGVIDIDVAHEREPQEPHRFLPVHEQDDPRVTLSLQLRDFARAHRLQHALSQHRLQRR